MREEFRDARILIPAAWAPSDVETLVNHPIFDGATTDPITVDYQSYQSQRVSRKQISPFRSSAKEGFETPYLG